MITKAAKDLKVGDVILDKSDVEFTVTNVTASGQSAVLDMQETTGVLMRPKVILHCNPRSKFKVIKEAE